MGYWGRELGMICGVLGTGKTGIGQSGDDSGVGVWWSWGRKLGTVPGDDL